MLVGFTFGENKELVSAVFIFFFFKWDLINLTVSHFYKFSTTPLLLKRYSQMRISAFVQL